MPSPTRTVVRDGRLLDSVYVSRANLAIIAERVERRRLPAVRSALLALLEASGDPNGWTRSALAERAGMSDVLFRDVVETLRELGFVQRLDDGSVQLSTPASVPAALPSSDPEAVVPVVPSERSERAEKFFAWHAAWVDQTYHSGKPRRTADAVAFASKILAKEPDGAAIKARLEWARTQRFFADKVIDMRGLARWWPRLNAAYLAEHSAPVADVPPPRVSYDSERVGNS